MSRITGTEFGEAFKMRVVSGMLAGGSLKVSWATGKQATSTLHWGFDSSVPNTVEDGSLVRYHSMFFPTTLLDTFHFFRVKSTTKSGETGISDIYHVYVPGQVILGSDMPQFVKLSVTPVTALSEKRTIMMPYNLTDFHWGYDPDVEPLNPQLAIAAATKSTPTQESTISDQSISTPYSITIT